MSLRMVKGTNGCIGVLLLLAFLFSVFKPFITFGAKSLRSKPPTINSNSVKTWKSCVVWSDTFPGLHNDWCRIDLDGAWDHIGQSQENCVPGYGKGVCAPANMSHLTLPQHQEAAISMLRKSHSRLKFLDLAIMDKVVGGRLSLLLTLHENIRGSVNIFDINDRLTERLDFCRKFKNLDFHLWMHALELWIPLHLRHHPTSSLLLGKSAKSSNDLTLTYVAAFPHTCSVCHWHSADFEKLELAVEHMKIVMNSIVGSAEWNRSNGVNFIIPATHPLVPPAFSVNPEVNLFSHATFLSVDYDGYAHYPKDIVVPYLADTSRKFYGYVSNSSRTNLLMLCSHATQFVRTKMLSIYSNIADDIIMIKGHVHPSIYDDYLSKTLFCLMVRGDTTSSARLFTIISAGCIPVIVADWVYLPYQLFIDYSSFCLFFREHVALNNPTKLINQLRSIKPSKIKEMQQALFQAQFLLALDSNYILNPVSLIFLEATIRRKCLWRSSSMKISELLCTVFNWP